jgi:hypothetical protein
MSSSRFSYDFFSNEWTSSSSDEEMLFNEMDQKVVMFFQCAFDVLNFEDLLNDHEDEGTKKFVDQVAKVQNALGTMQATPSLFKNLTNFTLTEFEELVS